jgi:hypothetical protein
MSYSATLTGWRRSQQSGEGKIFALLSRGKYIVQHRAFPVVPEYSGESPEMKKIVTVRRVDSNSLPKE